MLILLVAIYGIHTMVQLIDKHSRNEGGGSRRRQWRVMQGVIHFFASERKSSFFFVLAIAHFLTFHCISFSANMLGTECDTSDAVFATVGDKPVYFDEDWDTDIGGGLWSTGAAMAKYFERHAQSIRSSLKSGKRNNGRIRAIELGSGNGYLSVCLAAIAGDLLSELVVTDLADHLPLMKKTLERNSHLVDVEEGGEGRSTNDERPIAMVTEHKWGVNEKEESSAVCRKKFDFIFGSDVAYRDHLHSPLIASLDSLSHENTDTSLILIGVTMQDTKPSFFKALSDAGFRYERLPDHLMEPEFRGTTFGLFVIQRSKLPAPPRK